MRIFKTLHLYRDIYTTAKLSLAANEFTDRKDKIGLYKSDPDVTSFLTIDSFDTQYTAIIPGRSEELVTVNVNGQNSSLPKADLNIELSAKLNEYERTKYTIFDLVGDLGGFSSAVTIFPMIFMGFYSSRMFASSVTANEPFRESDKAQNNEQL